ncbi:hypothetical protein DRW48_10325 [Paracoccus suum]|uniref:Uncharacterized protein n=1 Tax=Paracoccus suum TaxID=2259340 RepID=A0A344PKX8_9RHOB|nr:hypothetical protein [Paracoccus suum]AXC50033.1 hypothetical protein DRW48_10325 [Paracoccus suum]
MNAMSQMPDHPGPHQHPTPSAVLCAIAEEMARYNRANPDAPQRATFMAVVRDGVSRANAEHRAAREVWGLV